MEIFAKIKSWLKPIFGPNIGSDEFHVQKQKKYDRFCYIYGSFAQTAPYFRTTTSDIDVICSFDIDQYEVRAYLREKYPDIPANVVLDIKYQIPDSDGTVYYPINYWQQEKYISLVDNRNIKFLAERHGINISSVVRNPDKSQLQDFFRNTDHLDIKPLYHFIKSVRTHYGMENFRKVLDESSLFFYEKQIFNELFEINNDLSPECGGRSANIMINRKTDQIISDGTAYNYFTFFQKCLGHGYIYSTWYAAFPTFFKKN